MKNPPFAFLWIRFLSIALVTSLSMIAQSESKPQMQGILVLQAGEASTFSLPLADFGKGPQQQDMALFQFNNVFTKNDGLVAYEWQTIDQHGAVDWDATVSYRRPVVKIAGGTISAGTGVQRWHLPLVAGSNDWVSDNSLYYERPGRVPLFFQADSKTVVSSNREFAKGSFVVLTANTPVALRKSARYNISLRHGPTYVGALGMYGIHGNRAFRYEAALIVSHDAYNFELLARPQIGLQASLPNSFYWGASITRAFHILPPRER